jgi:GT2 family glycosyltransferase
MFQATSRVAPLNRKGMKTLSIVIVTWNCKGFIQDCLDSLVAFRQAPEAEIIVVDNASRDGTPDLVQDSYPEVMLIRSRDNLGFTRANNIGIRKASGEYICLINPDVRVMDGCIRSMLAHMEKNPRIGLLGPRMLGTDGKSHRSYMGAPTLWSTFCRALALDVLFPASKFFGGFLMPYFKGDQIADVEVLNGWFWMTRREALSDVGLLDETLFMYGDDLDWSKRFRDAGWRVVYFPAAQSLHYGGGTTARAPIPFYVEMHRANFQYWKKNHSRVSQSIYLLIVWMHEALRLVGYSLLFMGSRSKRTEAVFKTRRSLACLGWSMGLRYRKEGTGL